MSQMYKPKAAAAELGVRVETLRRWDREGKLRPAIKTAGGHRRYSQEQIDQLRSQK